MTHPRQSRRLATTIGGRVRVRRIAVGLTEEAVARALDCAVDDLRAAEQGEMNFTAEDIVGLCTILRVRPSWFFEGIV